MSSWWRMAVSGKQRPRKTSWMACRICGCAAHIPGPIPKGFWCDKGVHTPMSDPTGFAQK